MKRLALILLALSLCLSAKAQQPRYVSADFDFVEYLIGGKMGKDAAAYLEGTYFAPSDTLDFLRGWANYNIKKLDRAAEYFAKVPQGSVFYDKALFFGAVSNVYEGDYDRSVSLLKSYDGPYEELREYQLAGIALLRNDEEAYRQAAYYFTHQSYALAGGERMFESICEERYDTRGKSPFVAAAASAVIPGLGKVYAGRLDEGISAFLTVGAFAAITAENWIKCGPTNWKTILFGTLGSIFYIGNIYGSYVSVGITNLETQNAQNTTVIYNLHLPLRNIFE